MITPDTKDWTWVITRACPDCGYDAEAVEPASVGARVRSTLPRWADVLARPDVAVRPDAATWSALEYACHVRDVFRIFDGRLTLMLDEVDPLFANWDQDETAVTEQYAEQDPAVVRDELLAAGETVAGRFDTVTGSGWDRSGRRTDGAHFTTVSFARYFLHDDVHHLYDVAG